jgi:hypothetical protein
MPTRTDRQLAADALHRAFLVNFVADLEQRELDFESDSESESEDSDDDLDMDVDSSEDSSSDSESSDDDSDPDLITPAETYIHHMANFYSERYMAERTNIPKSQQLMHLLLNDYKVNHPLIFRSYLSIDPACFDALVEAIRDDEIFLSNSNNSQMSRYSFFNLLRCQVKV